MNKTELTEAAGIQPVAFCYPSYLFSTFTDIIRKPVKIGCAEVV